MDDEQWRKRLHEATYAALERLRAPELDVKRDLISDLERLLADIEAQASDGSSREARENAVSDSRVNAFGRRACG